ncbi:MAG: ATPase [Rhodococcus erythropolis]|nr:ATPase [Rhodococcus erythropolis]
MSSRHPTRVGRVTSIVGSTVLVELESELAGVSPTWNGHLHTIGQVGTTVSLPQGASTLLASVTRMSMHGAIAPDGVGSGDLVSSDMRVMEVQLLGEIDALGTFHRGVSSYPGIYDPVHFVSGDELLPIYPRMDAGHLRVGRLSANSSVEVSLDLEKLVMRHSAIVGSTGAGKSSVVTSILQALGAGPWPSARVVVVDSHGEYATAVKEEALHTDLATSELAVLPMWLLPSRDILAVLLRGAPSNTLVTKFDSLVSDARRAFAARATWLDLDEEDVNADSPIPFDMRDVWYELDKANRRTCLDKEKTQDALANEGDAANLQPASFVPYGPSASEPYKGPDNATFGTYPDQLRRALRDPGEVVIGSILQLLFELAIRGGDSELGRSAPLLVVVEEAHRYFSSSSTSKVARTYVDRISREGRKYGVGLMLVSQRPSELPATAMSQVGTIIALRLNNDADQSSVGSALPDNLSGLVQSLPSLRTGEAIVSGEALPIPSRVRMQKPNPWPLSHDPEITAWAQAPRSQLDLNKSLAKWRVSS